MPPAYALNLPDLCGTHTSSRITIDRPPPESLWLVLPASIPAIAVGLLLGIGRALIGTVTGEFFGASAGLGFRIALYGTEMQIGDMFVPIIVVIIIGVVRLHLRWVERSVEAWRG